ncbi:MAG: NADH-quinone oxidoreductase subunit NuoE [Candidatus Thermoplasmatota archaeon]|nr:NADH-quinone oxidoreductase subunit NuoE [Candidatus Thermoplasmatota archaeon]
MKLECENCGFEWDYQGEEQYYATCPECQYEVEIPAEAEVVAPERDIEDILEEHPAEQSSLIPILQETQEQYGYLPKEVIEDIAGYLGLPESKIYGVATFYAQFRFEPQGEHVVRICHGTACHVKGADAITETVENELGIDTGETSEDGTFTLERVACLGCCSLAPVIMVDDTAHGDLTREKVKDVIDDYRGSSS